MPSIRQFIMENPHLFSEDSDYSSSESEEESDSDNEEIGNMQGNSSSRAELTFSPIFRQTPPRPPKVGRPATGKRLDIVTLHAGAYESPFTLFQV